MFQYKRMYKPAFSAYPTAKILISTNHLPRFTDTSEGIWSRMLLIPFNHQFVEGRDMDKRLKDKLFATEMPGIISWALEGARRLTENKGVFSNSETSKRALMDYRREVFPEIDFFDENFESCDLNDGTMAVSCAVFRNAYEKWCRRQGCKPKGYQRISKLMAKMIGKYARKQKRVGDNQVWYYFGIKMKTDSEFWGDGSLVSNEEVESV